MMPPIALSSVDLPEPFWPMSPTVEPAWIVTLTSSSAQKSWRCFRPRGRA